MPSAERGVGLVGRRFPGRPSFRPEYFMRVEGSARRLRSRFGASGDRTVTDSEEERNGNPDYTDHDPDAANSVAAGCHTWLVGKRSAERAAAKRSTARSPVEMV